MLKGNKVTVSSTLTKQEANAIQKAPKLTVAVYAVQKEGMDSADKAWAAAKAN